MDTTDHLSNDRAISAIVSAFLIPRLKSIDHAGKLQTRGICVDIGSNGGGTDLRGNGL